ncbi:unnamed protein product, partial [Durusdinium trenchii]
MTRTRSYRIFWDKKKFFWKGPPLRTILQLVMPHQPLKLNADDMYFLTDEELEKECGRASMFDLTLSHSATDFKSIYEQNYGTALVWDLSQNPSEQTKRGRTSTVDGSLPTFTTS